MQLSELIGPLTETRLHLDLGTRRWKIEIPSDLWTAMERGCVRASSRQQRRSADLHLPLGRARFEVGALRAMLQANALRWPPQLLSVHA